MRTSSATFLSALVCLGLLTAPGRASAQDRAGGWFGGGGGWGSADLTCDDCGSGGDREDSGVFYLNGGWTLNKHVLLGGEFNLWMKTFTDPDFAGNVDVNFYNLLGTATFYPSSTGGFFIKGGAGIAFFDMDVKDAGITATIDMGKGLGLIVGGGYDIPVGRIAIPVAVNYWYANTGDLTVMNQAVLTGVSHNVFTVTVGVKFP